MQFEKLTQHTASTSPVLRTGAPPRSDATVVKNGLVRIPRSVLTASKAVVGFKRPATLTCRPAEDGEMGLAVKKFSESSFLVRFNSVFKQLQLRPEEVQGRYPIRVENGVILIELEQKVNESD